MSAQLAKLFSTPTLVQATAYAAAGVATKSVGSVARYLDDRQAPTEVKEKTVKREATLNGLAFASLFAIQLLYSWASATPPALKAISPKVANFLTKPSVQPLARLAMAVPAFAMAELLSRVVAPRKVWENGHVIGAGVQAKTADTNAQNLTPPAPPLATFPNSPAANAPSFTLIRLMPSPPVAQAAIPQPRFTNAGGVYAGFSG